MLMNEFDKPKERESTIRDEIYPCGDDKYPAIIKLVLIVLVDIPVKRPATTVLLTVVILVALVTPVLLP